MENLREDHHKDLYYLHENRVKHLFNGEFSEYLSKEDLPKLASFFLEEEN